MEDDCGTNKPLLGMREALGGELRVGVACRVRVEEHEESVLLGGTPWVPKLSTNCA